METSVFFDLVGKSFQYLLDECGFSMIGREVFPHYDDAEVVFQAADCRIRVGRDRGDVYLDISSIASPEYWYGLPTILAYLTQGKIRGWDYGFAADADHDAKMDRQVHKLAEMLRPYCAKVRELSREGILDRERAQLKDIMMHLANEWLDKL